MEIYYTAIDFYVAEQPMQLNALLTVIAPKADHGRVVQLMRKTNHLNMILPYLKQVQPNNIQQVNEAVNELYVEMEAFEDLRGSIEEFDNFDQIALAQKLEKHELLEMRRIAALLYKKNKRYKQSIDLSKQDKMFQDAMETARDSGNQELAEALIGFFLESKDKECFSACLYTCYQLVRPDMVLGLAWQHGYMDFAMPYFVQCMREFTGRVEALDKKDKKKDEEEEKSKSAANDYVDPSFMMGGGMPGLGGQAMLMPPPTGMMGGMPGGPMGQPQMMQTPNMGGMPGPMGAPQMGGPGMPQAMYPGGQMM